jgi:hypothetical protein
MSTPFWYFDNLKEIGRNKVSVVGDPQIIETDNSKALYFDGNEDRVLIHTNPIGVSTEFTVEIVFKADGDFPNNIAPRFMHIQNPKDKEEKRILMELRINENNRWYLDSYINTDKDSLVLIDENLNHPTNIWMHAAIVYKNKTLSSYVNRKKELEGKVDFNRCIIDENSIVSVGGRMNHVSLYKGAVRKMRVSQTALEPIDFIRTANQELE